MLQKKMYTKVIIYMYIFFIWSYPINLLCDSFLHYLNKSILLAKYKTFITFLCNRVLLISILLAHYSEYLLPFLTSIIYRLIHKTNMHIPQKSLFFRSKKIFLNVHHYAEIMQIVNIFVSLLSWKIISLRTFWGNEMPNLMHFHLKLLFTCCVR